MHLQSAQSVHLQSVAVNFRVKLPDITPSSSARVGPPLRVPWQAALATDIKGWARALDSPLQHGDCEGTKDLRRWTCEEAQVPQTT